MVQHCATILMDLNEKVNVEDLRQQELLNMDLLLEDGGEVLDLMKNKTAIDHPFHHALFTTDKTEARRRTSIVFRFDSKGQAHPEQIPHEH